MRTQHILHHAAYLEIKSLAETGRFAGYASVFDVVDSQQDSVVRGAFVATIKDRAGEIKLLWQHQMSEPVGVITNLFEDARGLYVEGTLLMEVARAREVYALLKSRAINGLSIGYTPVEYSIDRDSGVRRLKQVVLHEISFVTFPANSEATVTVVKSGEDEERAMKTAQATGELYLLAEALERSQSALQALMD